MGAEEPVDCRQWTQHHLVAADIRVAPAMALTPPQGDVDADGMDVNVRGPGQCPSPENRVHLVL
jgi:Notch-like protein